MSDVNGIPSIELSELDSLKLQNIKLKAYNAYLQYVKQFDEEFNRLVVSILKENGIPEEKWSKVRISDDLKRIEFVKD